MILDMFDDGMLSTALMALLLFACVAWTAVSALGILRHVWGLQRRARGLIRRTATMEREIVLSEESTAAQKRRGAQLIETLAERSAALRELEHRLESLRGDSSSEYQVLSESHSAGGSLFLFTTAKGDPPSVRRWVVPAHDADAAAQALKAVVGGDATLTQVGKL
jgi:hypothetical protein